MTTNQANVENIDLPRLRVTAPCRLHFGLLSFGRDVGRQFGGAGVMLADPDCCLEVFTAPKFTVEGNGSDRVQQFAASWQKNRNRPTLPDCCIRIVRRLPSHVGLGSGTQLALATATALDRFCGEPASTPLDLATSVGRGLRSAVGTYGFCSGGFIAELGKAAGDALAPLERRVSVPDDWRFMLIRPADKAAVVSGEAEKAAFRNLPPVALSTTEELTNRLLNEIVPAVEAADCDAFGEAIYHYGLAAGNCFAECQGGPFATPQLAELVAAIRSMGVRGVGQSSWGPTLFAVLPNEAEAAKLVGELSDRFGKELELSTSAVNNSGATVSELLD